MAGIFSFVIEGAVMIEVANGILLSKKMIEYFYNEQEVHSHGTKIQ